MFLWTSDRRLCQCISRHLRKIIGHRVLFGRNRVSFCSSFLCWSSIRGINAILGLLRSSSMFLGSEERRGLIEKLSSRRHSLRDDRDRERDRTDRLWRHSESLD